MSDPVGECVVAGMLANVFSVPALTLPAVLAARRVLTRRSTPPLGRTRTEKVLVLGAALIGAAGAVAWSNALGAALDPGRGAALWLLGWFVPAPLAAIPWFAGEVLSGASSRPFHGLAVSIATCCAFSWVGFAVLERPVTDASGCHLALQLAVASIGALAAAGAYLAERGEARAELPPEAVAIDEAL